MVASDKHGAHLTFEDGESYETIEAMSGLGFLQRVDYDSTAPVYASDELMPYAPSVVVTVNCDCPRCNMTDPSIVAAALYETPGYKLVGRRQQVGKATWTAIETLRYYHCMLGHPSLQRLVSGNDTRRGVLARSVQLDHRDGSEARVPVHMRSSPANRGECDE